MNKASIFSHGYSAVMICSCLALGYGVNAFVDFLPAALYGMLILTFGLQAEIIDSGRVKNSIDWIIKHMGVCFVPAGVGIMEYKALIAEFGVLITIHVIISTTILLIISGLMYQKCLNRHIQAESKTAKANKDA